MYKLTKEEMKALFGILLVWATWVTVTMYSVSAKADRVIAVEDKVDYIYKYLIEKNKGN